MRKKDYGWREYQSSLNRRKKRRALLKKAAFALPVSVIFCFCFLQMSIFSSAETEPVKKVSLAQKKAHSLLSKKDIRKLSGKITLLNSTEKFFTLKEKNKSITFKTTLDPELQQVLTNKISNLNKLGRGEPVFLAIVAVNPDTGEIIALTGYDKNNNFKNVCLSSLFPAASLFKIVTASAAIEKSGYSANTRLRFNGNKYTLYKNQLKRKNNKYTNKISLKDSFAQSVNPVFGKIGLYDLGKINLEKYGEAFGFNKQINFELPIKESRLSIKDTPYNWAEIACGFNNDTVISPIHVALITSAVLNGGTFLEPTIIESAFNDNGHTIYKSHKTPITKAISKSTSKEIRKLMKRTITSGTCRKSFRHMNRDPVLASLYIGGKTGSIYNRAHNIKFDWFTGFAEKKNGNNKIAVAVVVGHGKYIGKRAASYAKLTIKEFFIEKQKSKSMAEIRRKSKNINL